MLQKTQILTNYDYDKINIDIINTKESRQTMFL